MDASGAATSWQSRRRRLASNPGPSNSDRGGGAGNESGGNAPVKTSSSPNFLGLVGGSTFSLPPKLWGDGHASSNGLSVHPFNGSMRLSIPLPTGDTNCELTPILKLFYSISMSNSPFGIGWNLDLTSISRKTNRQIPSYGDLDVFLLSGIELVSTSSAGRKQGDYLVHGYGMRVHMENELQVERWTSISNINDVFWRTLSDGQTSFYGRDSSSRVFEHEENGDKILSWLLCESSDTRGNAVAYSYKSENDDGLEDLPVDQQVQELAKDSSSRARMRYIKRITYGNISPVKDAQAWEIKSTSNTDWSFSIVFDYGEHDENVPTTDESKTWKVRQDCFSSARSGFEIRTYRLCRRVLVFQHLPKVSGQNDSLVASLLLSYREGASTSFLESVLQQSHVYNSTTKTYTSQSKAPLSMTYASQAPMQPSNLLTKKPTSLQGIETLEPGAVTHWVDLDGEGTPGLLAQIGDAWFFQRNENALCPGLSSSSESNSGSESNEDGFGPVRELSSMPAVADYTQVWFENVDGSGLHDMVVADADGRVVGYHQRLAGCDSWNQLQPFTSVPNMDLGGGTVPMDLTGNGLNDLLVAGDEPGSLAWHPNLGRQGFGERRGCELSRSNGVGAINLVGDGETTVFLADMTGDGLQDIVHISSGKVTYYANLGHGHFGQQVLMRNAPTLIDSHGFFSSERILLMDADGSHTTDIVYFHPSGGATIFFNECGNSFSAGTHIPGVPSLDQMSSVFALDILGQGISSLCWLGPESAGIDELVLRLVNLATGGMPHLLTKYEDGEGKKMSIEYRSSAAFYLQDDQQGQAWAKGLPFSTPLVWKVDNKDETAGISRTITYRYHDGLYDPVEREFCGFGSAETWEEGETGTPIRHTKLWYYTGDPETSLAPSHTNGSVQKHTKIPELASQNSRPELFRSLKGLLVRKEVYKQVGTSSSDVLETIQEEAYEIDMQKEPSRPGEPGICRVRLK